MAVRARLGLRARSGTVAVHAPGTWTCTSNARSRPFMCRPQRLARSGVVRSTTVQLRGTSTGSTRGRATTPGRSSSALARSGRQGLQALNHRRWSRHAATLSLVVAGAWYGVEQGSQRAILLAGAGAGAGAGALAWLVWPEVSTFLAWRRRRRTQGARARLERAMSQADRDVAKAERARQRADRRPSSPRRARRAERMEKRALRAVARAARARDLAAGLDGETTAR